ncbi:hypothetical protein SORBI_3003G035266 [Sorghum bicolor]|uniref:Uncharacterized protein n=1 Tax=Sorghum bicolor TaxID=4558 RepID=A0A1W0VVM7_SORBI|nr:hypothetical protein SORBI_3003G035266 [Sorghum bicolor]
MRRRGINMPAWLHHRSMGDRARPAAEATTTTTTGGGARRCVVHARPDESLLDASSAAACRVLSLAFCQSPKPIAPGLLSGWLALTYSPLDQHHLRPCACICCCLASSDRCLRPWWVSAPDRRWATGLETRAAARGPTSTTRLQLFHAWMGRWGWADEHDDKTDASMQSDYVRTT